MTNQELKIQKWEFLKQDILSKISTEHSINIEGLEDDSMYFNPIIKLDENITIKGQGDINTDRIYGWDLHVEQPLNCLIYTVSFDINSFEYLIRLLENWDKYKNKILQYIEIGKYINENIEMLNEIKGNIQSKLLNDNFDEEDKRVCLRKLFKVKEWIENERIIEKYSH